MKLAIRWLKPFLALVLAITLLPTSSAAPSADLVAVRAEVERLQEDAAEAGENAQAAKIQLARLKSQLESVRQEADLQKAFKKFHLSVRFFYFINRHYNFLIALYFSFL